MSVEGSDAATQTRMAALYLLTDAASRQPLGGSAEWILTCQAAKLPETPKKPPRVLLSYDFVGEMFLPTEEAMPGIIQDIIRAEKGSVDFTAHQQELFELRDGIPTSPPDPTGRRRAHQIGRVFLALLSTLGATRQAGPAGRGSVFRQLADQGKGKGKGGKSKGKGRSKRAAAEEEGWDASGDWWPQ